MSRPGCFGHYLSGNIAAERDCGRCFWEGKCRDETSNRDAVRVRNWEQRQAATERDPAGLPPHAPGAKLDGEKVMAELTLDGFSRALLAIAEVSTYGAKKYSPGGWQHVDDGQTRYRRAGDRHRLARGHEPYDLESGLMHLAHEVWNRLAELELMLRADAVESAIPELDPGSATSPAGRHTGAPDAAPEQAATEAHRAAGKPAGDTFWHVRFLTRYAQFPQKAVVSAASSSTARAEVCRVIPGVSEILEVRRAE